MNVNRNMTDREALACWKSRRAVRLGALSMLVVVMSLVGGASGHLCDGGPSWVDPNGPPLDTDPRLGGLGQMDPNDLKQVAISSYRWVGSGQ
jgi:hypothetical protein